MGARTEAPIVNQWALVIFIDFACNRDRFCLLYLPRPFLFGRGRASKKAFKFVVYDQRMDQAEFFFSSPRYGERRCLAMHWGFVLNLFRWCSFWILIRVWMKSGRRIIFSLAFFGEICYDGWMDAICHILFRKITIKNLEMIRKG